MPLSLTQLLLQRRAVEHVLGTRAAGDTIETILEGYPRLEPEDVRACFFWGPRGVGHERTVPLPIEARDTGFRMPRPVLEWKRTADPDSTGSADELMTAGKWGVTMTSTLQDAFQKAAALPPDQQEALAAILLEEMADDERWQRSFARSQDALSKLAAEALEEHAQGQTRDLDELL